MEFNGFNHNPTISTPPITSYFPMVPPPASLYTCPDYAPFPDGSMGRNNIIPDYYGGVSYEILKERIRQEIYADMQREKAWKEEIRREILMERDFSAQKVMYAYMALKEEIRREILMERDFSASKTMLPYLSNTKDYREGSVSRLSGFIDDVAREKMPFQRHPEAAMAAEAELAARSAKNRLLLLPKSKKKVLPRIGFGTMDPRSAKERSSLLTKPNWKMLPTINSGKQDFRCTICELSLTSAKHLEGHIKGKKHQAKVSNSEIKHKATPDGKSLKEGFTQEVHTDVAREKASATKLEASAVKFEWVPKSAEERSLHLAKPNEKPLFRCALCELSLESEQVLLSHIRGKKHQAKVSNLEIEHKATPNDESLKDGFTQEVNTDVAREKASTPKLEASALNVELAPQSAEEKSLQLAKANGKLLSGCACSELSLTSAEELEAHIGCKKHAKVSNSEIKQNATPNDESLKVGFTQEVHTDVARENVSSPKLEASALKVELAPQSAEEKSLHLPKPNGKPLFRCALCELSLESEQVLISHIRGKKHLAKVSNLEIKHEAMPNDEPLKDGFTQEVHTDVAREKASTSKLEASALKVELVPQFAKDLAKPNGELLSGCACCELSLTRAQDLEAHIGSKKHQAKVSDSEIKHKAMPNDESLEEGFTQEVHTDVARETASAPKLEACALKVELVPQSAEEKSLHLPKPNGKPLFRCAHCELSLESEQVLISHIRGKKHQAKVSNLEIIHKARPNGGSLKDGFTQEVNTDVTREKASPPKLDASGLKVELAPQSAEEKSLHLPKPNSKLLFRCALCELSMTSAQDLESHIGGKKHQAKVSDSEIQHKAKPNGESLKVGFTQEVYTDVAQEKAPAPKLEAISLKVELAPQSAEGSLHLPKPNSKLLFRCALCELSMTSAKDLEAHIGGKKHQAKVLESKIKQKAMSNGEPLKEGTRQVMHPDVWQEKASAQDYRRVPFCYKV